MPTSASPARLILDTPILAVLDEMQADLARLARLEPSSGARHTLDTYVERLRTALAEADQPDIWVDTSEAARLRGVETAAAITHLCRKGKIVARKRGGIWEVHKDSVRADTRTFSVAHKAS